MLSCKAQPVLGSVEQTEGLCLARHMCSVGTYRMAKYGVLPTIVIWLGAH